ncbi:MAG TPA: PQQ-binding-like beta-propeller repeat protein [Gemmatimonadaceae bacterium]|jgi:quinoprotein glucose dehydrogenase|nr:PQQ-binding-like beta-propeller repeat protein [Gemmatimonadaceae bacterium]
MLALIAGCAALTAAPAAARAQHAPFSTAHGEWPSYTGDTRGSRYSPLDQISASNFSSLEIAWRFKTDSLGPRPEFKLEGTPLMVGGVLYSTGGTGRAVVALDAATGAVRWIHREDEGPRGAAAPRQLSGRGLAYWTDGRDERILYVSPGYRLIALNAKTGAAIPEFGANGSVDLKTDIDQSILPDLVTGEIGFQGAPVIGRDVAVIGAAFREGTAPRSFRNNKGYIRGYDVRSGRRLWTFHTIPQKGEPGYETWLDGSAEYSGNTGVWSQATIDEELGLVYLPVESPTGDYYGGHRPGNNLYGESIVCLDLRTGSRKWHYQIVHHPIWDFDLPAAPILADITVGGRAIKAVAVPTKQGILYVFDRITGKPVWPIEERPVEKGDVPGEWYSPTQPMPTRPAAYAKNGTSLDDLVDFTPDLHAQAVALASRYKPGPIFTPPVVSRPEGPYGTLARGPTNGGSNWPGGAFDPETHTFYVASSNAAAVVLGLLPPAKDRSDMNYIAGNAAPGGRALGGGLSVQGLSIFKPPYGTLTAIDLDRGAIKWQVPHGETPDAVRNSEALKGIEIPRTGQPGFTVGTLVTKTLVIAGDAQVTSPPGRARGAMLRAYDKTTGAEVGAVLLPAPASGSPMTYAVGGQQYIVVAVSGGPYSGEYIALRAPGAGPR